ncbi:uncharacterized protein DUF385 [Rhodococcus sp. AG1013]|uniref:nitroreductase/quinone reductase family protein n=1 Tax=Rhodococcus sp. AG1013 TaxID=2183996 RepID=UPI000E0BA6DE|nr:nitroreductase/quinone reductase family protein [Rhodococcus sp. AG1013]RDI20514.1 uncharacterized protein DUF385 [Rhodococcus sp. AG1013]
MTFSHPRGTRGARPPHGRMVRWVNKFAMGRVRRGGRFMNLAAHLHDTERDDAWATITAAAPQFTEYEQKTDRELPVIGLTRRS